MDSNGFTGSSKSVSRLGHTLPSRDVPTYLNLGKGGTPPTFVGWLRVSRLKYIGGLWSVLHPPETPLTMYPYRGKLDLSTLPQRKGTRPQVGGIAAQ
jgi:hypothetical protein